MKFNLEILTRILYLISSIFAINGIRNISAIKTASSGIRLLSWGIILAVITTFAGPQMSDYIWPFSALVSGIIAGLIISRIPTMKNIAETVAYMNAFAGLACMMVGWTIFHSEPHMTFFRAFTVFPAIYAGAFAFSGSLAYVGRSKNIFNRGGIIHVQLQKKMNVPIALITIASWVVFILISGELRYLFFPVILFFALGQGLLILNPVRKQDISIVSCLLNSITGIAVFFLGFSMPSMILIIIGALIFTGGFHLTRIMARGMNKRLLEVLFRSYLYSTGKSTIIPRDGEIRSITTDDAFYLLEASLNVVIVPGYGLALSRGHNYLGELIDKLEKNGAFVRVAIHPAAGRMPGQMNMLLAEAHVPNEVQVSLEEINEQMDKVDLCIVAGASDVVNTAARVPGQSTLSGMPIIEADRASMVLVLKRSLAAGFSGVDNPLFTNAKTRILFGDAGENIKYLADRFS